MIFLKKTRGKVWAGGCGGNCAACGVTSVPGVKQEGPEQGERLPSLFHLEWEIAFPSLLTA